MLSSNQKGAIARPEKAIELAAIKAGVAVYRPIAEGGRCDLIFEVADTLLQCKWIARRGDVVPVRCYSSFRNRDGFVRRSYSAYEVDVLAAYCPDVERCYVLPSRLFAKQLEVQLRLAPTRNNQKRGIHLARRFELEKVNWSEFSVGP